MAFHEQDADIRLAFDRLEKSLEATGATSKDVVFANFYPLTRMMEEKLRIFQPQYFPQSLGSILPFEGLPSIDASMAMDVIAVVRK